MKIAFYLISDGIGGAETVVKKLISELIKISNFEVYIIVNNEISKYFFDLLPQSNILVLPDVYLHLNKKWRSVRYVLNNRYYSVKPYRILCQKEKIESFILKNQIQIIHTHLEYALWSAIRLKSKNSGLYLIHTIHSEFGLNSKINLKPQIDFKYIDFYKVDHIVFVASYLKDLFYKTFNYHPASNVIYNGYTIPEFFKKSIPSDKKDPKVIKLLYVGGEKEVKGFDVLIESLNILVHRYDVKNIELTILGVLPINGKIINGIRKYKIDPYCRLVGYVQSPEHLIYFQTADLLLLPSKTESMPLAAIEAILYDLPVIANNVGGIPEIIQDGKNGYLVESNADCFAKKLSVAIKTIDSLKKSALKHNLILKKEFDLNSFIFNHIRIYKKIN